MKTNKYTFIIAAFLCISISGNLFSQTEVPDTIFMLGGKKIYSKILGVSSSKVTYKEFGREDVKYIERKQIEKIVYKNGAKEIFNKPIFSVVEQSDYRIVILTNSESDVEGLVKKGKVESESSKGSKTMKSAKRSAEIRLQKRAANMEAQIVLITKKETVGGYGEVPSYRLEGIAYSIPMY